MPGNLPPPAAPVPTVTSNAAFENEAFDEDGGPHLRFIGFSDFSAAVPASFGGNFAYFWEVVTASSFTTLTSPPPPILPPSTNLR